MAGTTLNRTSFGRIAHRRYAITTLGNAGAAVASVETGLPAGVLRFIKVDYSGSAPATTDVTLTDGDGGTARLTLTSTVTDIPIRAIGVPGIDEAAGAIASTDGTSGGAYFKNGVTVEVAQSDSLAPALTLDLWYEQLELVTVELAPLGADGSAVATRLVDFHSAGVVRAISVDYQNQPATVDLVIKADDSAGETIFTRTSSATDIDAQPIGTVAIDEGNAATAATDATDGGFPFRKGLYFDVAQGDGFGGGGNEKIVVSLWIDV